MRDQAILKIHDELRANLNKLGDAHNALAREHAQTRGAQAAFVRLGFWNRLKWLVRGVEAFQPKVRPAEDTTETK